MHDYPLRLRDAVDPVEVLYFLGSWELAESPRCRLMEKMPLCLTVLGEAESKDHYCLGPDARCFFWSEYTPFEHTKGLRWNYSATNKLITNLKKKMDRQGQTDWPYKKQAIHEIAQTFSATWRWPELHQAHGAALIPVPPSKPRASPMYDNRMLKVLNEIVDKAGVNLDIRDCLSFSGKYAASHEANARPTPDELYADLSLDNVAGKIDVQPGVIFVFDDMLTTGAHYVATCRMWHGSKSTHFCEH